MDSSGEENGQVTIIGGSQLFHGAPIFALKAASRIVDMVFFASPDPTLEGVATQIKAQLNSFIWTPWEEVREYVAKSDAVLIGPGFLRYHSEKTAHEQRLLLCDEECRKTKQITKDLLQEFPGKQWVVDGGSLQVIDLDWLPKWTIITPNKHEYQRLFGDFSGVEKLAEEAKNNNLVIVYKGAVSYATDGKTTYEIDGGNAGLTKGGTGDVLAGVTVGLAAKNKPLAAAAAASYVVKKTAEYLYEQVGYNYNADDVAQSVFHIWNSLSRG